MDKLHDWTECALWEALERRQDDHVQECRLTLLRVMPKIQTVLESGGTAPKDFTLHDAGHSHRVAKRMFELVESQIDVLSSFELALLLLAAYCHDIGMTPEFEQVDKHHGYLLTGDRSRLEPDEFDAFQRWLDDEGYQAVEPLRNSTAQIALASEITTYYCRARHNDWSAGWIGKHLSGETLGTYSNWVDDLIRLCQSHHFGYDRLIDQTFSPRWVGTPPVVSNLRFLALVLRVADILEFDPERTPDVILRHRDVIPESRIFWWKDKGISLMMEQDKIVLTSRPKSARIHKAIEDMVTEIDRELALCRKIAGSFPLGAVPGASEPHPYKWTLAAALHADIKPEEGAYEYIDGAFRPNTKKLLSLLSGTALCQNPLHAVRELVQNAFDAVCERIAYQRLTQPNPSSSTLASDLAKQHRVSLQVETDGADAFLVCSDSGIGMSKDVIKDRVLVSGSGPRHDVKALGRRCTQQGFHLDRSGQFGIGMLSYFMIADCAEIQTRRSQEADDADSVTWHFETEGIGSFGELRKIKTNRQGTMIRLRLNSDITANLTSWYSALRTYLEATLAYCPCGFQLTAPMPGCKSLEFHPGWCPRPIGHIACSRLRRGVSNNEPPLHLVSSDEREKRIAADQESQETQDELLSCLKWHEAEGVLDNHAGHFMISIPYFELEGGRSLAFLKITQGKAGVGNAVRPFLNGTYYSCERYVEESWKGMTISRPDLRRERLITLPQSILRINWISDDAGSIAVHRNQFSAGDASRTGDHDIRRQWTKMVEQFLEDNKDSSYAWLNERLVNSRKSWATRYRWLTMDGSAGANANGWETMAFPAISRAAFGYIEPKTTGLLLNGKPLNVVPMLASAAGQTYGKGWNSSHMPPDRIVDSSSWRVAMAPVWLRKPKSSEDKPWMDSIFPPQWGKVCGASFKWYSGQDERYEVWNRNHPLLKQLNTDAWDWCDRIFATSLDPILHRDAILSDTSKASAWILLCLRRKAWKIWNGLPERDPTFLRDIFAKLSSSKSYRDLTLLFWQEESTSEELYVVNAERWFSARTANAIREYLPVPSRQWQIEYPKGTPHFGHLIGGPVTDVSP